MSPSGDQQNLPCSGGAKAWIEVLHSYSGFLLAGTIRGGQGLINQRRLPSLCLNSSSQASGNSALYHGWGLACLHPRPSGIHTKKSRSVCGGLPSPSREMACQNPDMIFNFIVRASVPILSLMAFP